MGGILLTQSPEQDEARSSIQALARHQGSRLKTAGSIGMIAALVAAACMPVAWPLLGGIPAAAQAAVALLGATGSGYIGNSLKSVIERLRSKDGAPATKAELQEALERELLACLRTESEHSAGLRAEAASLLERLQAVETALAAASTDVQLALTDAFTDLGDSFGEFRWMLQEARHTLDAIEDEQARQGAEQRQQTEFLREFRIKINLALRRLDVLTIPSAVATAGEPADADGEGAVPAPGPCPYKGLETFQPEDGEMFFGRDQLVAELAVRLSETAFLAVIGPSGSGKSSVLRAGLLPAVWRGKVAGEVAWTTIAMTPGAHPLEELAARVGVECGVAAGLLLDDWRADPDRLRLGLRQVLAKAPATRLFLLVDQLEEVFTLCSNQVERRTFIRGLTAAISDRDTQVSVVLGMRADFYARCAEYPELIEVMQDRQVLVGPMTAAELREAIIGPAEQAGLVLEPGLVETMLADLGEEPGSLPLLSHALFATWQRRRGRTLTMAGYQEAGGVRQAIAQTAESVFGELDAVQQAIAKDVFLRLTALGEGTEDTRRRIRRAELAAVGDAQAVQVVLDRLAEARLVTVGEDSVEVAHEALIREWPTLRSWLAEDREGLRIHRRLTQAATEWEALGRDRGVVYEGLQLASTRDWEGRHRARLNDLERAFLVASGKRERDELVAARRRNRRLAALSAILVVASMVAVWQTNSARRQRNLATARQLSAEATANSDQQPLSLLLSLESLRIAPTNEGWTSLQQGVLHPRHNVLVLTGHTATVIGVAFSPDGKTVASASADGTVRLWEASTGKPVGQPLIGHTSAVYRVAFSPDSKTIASASADQTVRLWDASTGKSIGRLTGHSGPVNGVAFSPDGSTIASANDDGTVRLWDASTRRPIGQPLTGHSGPVNGVAFSPDGSTIASAGTDGTVRLWDASTGKPIGQPLTGHTGPAGGPAFSPDGKIIASVSDDGTVRLWDASTSRPIGQPLTGHTGAVFSVAFSPDGRTIASAGADQTVRLWETSTGKPIGDPLTARTGVVYAVAFSPDGKMLASAGSDETVRLWDASTGKPIGLTGHTGFVFGVAFSPDGRTIVSAGLDGTVRLWEASTGKPLGPPLTGHTGIVFGVAFSPDGKTLASAGSDETVRLWDASTGKPIGHPLTGHTGFVYGVAFSLDTKTMASAGDDGTVRLWEASTGHPLGRPLTGHIGPVNGVAFSPPDGRTMASAGDDGTVRLWDASTGKPIGHPLTAHTGPVGSVAFSPDAKTIASADDDGTVRLWEASTGKPLGRPLTGHIGPVNGVAFSPDGKTIASAGADQTVRLWEASTGKPIGHPLTAQTGPVKGVAFSPDGKTIASAGDGTLGLWPGSMDAWVRRVCTQAGRNLTQLEWDQYMAGRPYVRTCPYLPSGYGAPSNAPAASYHN